MSIDPHELADLLDRQAAALELYAAQWSDAPADVVQEAFIQLVRQPRPPRQAVPWLYRVVRNGAIAAARSAGRRRRHESAAARAAVGWFVPDEGASLDARAAAEALDELPDEQREVIVARIWGGLTFEQIGDVAGVSSSAAHRRYEAGLAALRERLGVSWPKKNACADANR